VALLAAPFGLGPLGKALAIASELRVRGYAVLILSDEIGARVASATGIAAARYTYRQPLALRDLKAAVVVSCLDVSTPLHKDGVPLVLLDSLLWLRGNWERAPSYNEDAYVAQRFFVDPSPETLSLIQSQLYFVEAVLPASFQELGPTVYPKNVVIYPGGMRSPYLDTRYQQAYLSWVLSASVDGLRQADVPIGDAIAILPPQLLHCAAAREFRSIGGQTVSALDDLAALVFSARCVVTAAGIEFVLEVLAAGKTPHFMPAYNGTHVPQLMAFAAAGIGSELCPSHSRELRRELHPEGGLSALSRRVAALNLRLMRCPAHREEFTNGLSRAVNMLSMPANRYPLGANGAGQVADVVEQYIRTQR
jgi:hypothetical protein